MKMSFVKLILSVNLQAVSIVMAATARGQALNSVNFKSIL